RGDRRGMAAAFRSDRADRTTSQSATVRGRRDFRGHSAFGGHAHVQNHRGNQQGPRGADLQDRRLRSGGRRAGNRAGSHERRSRSQEGALKSENVVFLFVVVVAAGFFSLNVQRLLQYLQLGKAERRT